MKYTEEEVLQFAEENDVKVQKLITEKMIYNFENK